MLCAIYTFNILWILKACILSDLHIITLSNSKLSQRWSWGNLKRHSKGLSLESYQSSACFTGGGSNLRERAVKIWLNFSYLSAWLTCAPLLPHSNRIWNSVLQISFISSSGWKPNQNKTNRKLLQFCLSRLESLLKVESKWTTSLSQNFKKCPQRKI